MGIFDKLFGKRKDMEKQQPPEIDPVVSEVINGLQSRIDELTETVQMLQEQPVNVDMSFKSMTYLEFLTEHRDRFVVLDVETTGLDPVSDEIVEVAVSRVVNGEKTESLAQYVKPEKSISKEASAVNHITDNMLVGMPSIKEVLPNVIRFIGSDSVVAHNASFDYRFLAVACSKCNLEVPSLWFDSKLLTDVWPDLENRKLSTFLAAAGIVNNNPHSASGDVDALSSLMIESIGKRFNITFPPDFDFGYTTEHFKGPVELIDDKLSGKRFVITGEVEGIERYDLEKMICAHGGKATVRISNATDYLVVGVYKKLPDWYISATEAYANKLIQEGGKIKIIYPADLFEMMK